jgi:hypothetical protein
MVPACVTALAVLPAIRAVAQDQPQYETPEYTTQTPSTLDKNYGLPTFGMPGSELPQQKTMAPPKEVPAKPGFFPDPTETALPRPRTPAQSGSETPLYTTTEGSTTGDGRSTTGETPLFDDGSDSTTGGSTSSDGTAAR